jgi:hypothetical protein
LAKTLGTPYPGFSTCVHLCSHPLEVVVSSLLL